MAKDNTANALLWEIRSILRITEQVLGADEWMKNMYQVARTFKMLDMYLSTDGNAELPDDWKS